ncbi:phospholipase-like protein, partial [Tanacetum coccineum]
SKQEDQIIRLADQRQQDDISKMADEAEQKIESEIQRLYDHTEARLNKIAEEEKLRKFIGHMNSSAHMKLAIKRCVPKKRKYVDVMRSPFSGLSETLNVPSMEQLANQKNVLNLLMIEKCKSVNPWIEDLKRPFNKIDRIFFSHDLEEWLSRSVVGHCKFPWCNDISVDRSFWHGLCGLDDNHKGWLVDEVFIPINEPKCHWSLAIFHICSGIVTFYNSEKTIATHDKEFRLWYLKMRQCLEEKILVVLKETGVFGKKNIDPARYKISFRHADHVPKQGGVFGDCGVFLCMFLYRLAYGVLLAVDDPVQAALAYREKMIHFYFQHKMFCP